jgi:hypothetical protein
MQLADFHMRHKGETALVCGVGPNLVLTPPWWFDYPSFGVNTIYKAAWDWEPTYFVGVDERLRLDDGPAICSRYADVPKFFPAPDWDALQGENIYRFAHRQGSNLYIGGRPATAKESLLTWGITYYRIMDAVFQIAAWMGFTTILCIGFQHKPIEKYRELFWGVDEREQSTDFAWEEIGYRETSAMLPVRILNISEDTHVPENVLPRDDWRRWANVKETA